MEIILLWRRNDWVAPQCIYLEQVHWTSIIYEPDRLWIQWDAILARRSSVWFAIKITDCMWVSIVWKQSYALIHVWRKGLYQWLIHSVVQKMYRHWECAIDMHVLISPCVHFLEVGRDWNDFNWFVPSNFLITNTQGFNEIDTVSWATHQLLFQWIDNKNIVAHSDDTITNNDRWFSNRVEWTKKKNWMLIQ